MNRTVKLCASAIVAIVLSFSFIACGDKKDDTSKGDKNYTYSTTLTKPQTWSPTDWEVNPENQIMGYTQMGLYDFAMNKTKDGYDVACEMAAEYPIDVTSTYAGNETYKVPTDAKEGYAWKIELNKDACWEDGTPITADTYEYSLKQLINPKMKNFRASTMYEGTMGLINAKEYYADGVAYDNIFDAGSGSYQDVADDDMFFTIVKKTAFFGDSLANGYGSYQDSFIDEDGTNMYTALQEIVSDKTYVPLTKEVKDYLVKIAANLGCEYSDAYKEFCLVKKNLKKVSWDEVGFIKNNDYSITFIFKNPITQFYVEYGTAGGLWLLKEDLYEANKKEVGDIVKSSYGTDVDKYSSFGPYKIVSYQADKDMHMVKNDKWYGWTDGKHENQFMSTGVSIQFIDKHETLMSLFLQGKIDEIELTATDLEKYGNSDFISYTPRSYTWKITMNSDPISLRTRDENGVNHSILSYKDFREGLFLSLDRDEYVSTIKTTHEPGYGLLNYSYVADAVTGELYRESAQAKKALCDVYKVENYNEITGYNLAAAKKLMQKAYDEALKAGDIKEKDLVTFNYHTYSDSESNNRIVAFVQQACDKATKGTSLEGRITINQIVDPDYYDNLKQGTCDMATTAWGGGAFDPYSVLQCYATNEYKNEYGFKPEIETLTINLNGEKLTKTYNEWYQALCSGEYVTKDFDTKNTILAACEKGLLETFTMAPLSYDQVAGLISHRLIQGSDTFINELVGHGGIRFLRYTMDDASWAEYCAKNNNQLSY